MISPCVEADSLRIWEIVNSAAAAYWGVIPEECWHEPYMSIDELRSEIDSGVLFVGYQKEGVLVGVMGSQNVDNVTLIRHAYVHPEAQRLGIGHSLLGHLLSAASRPVLVGTWSSATWAIRFYERHGFTLTSDDETRRLLERYWSVDERQMEASSVLTGPGWSERHAT
ncbi:MAG: GNAT family N-acetyltransferase [Gemmatimonadota bacterium]|nr:GNAT family N-acetyltransferase [Gemmatimonadota bacterium]